MGLSDAKLKKLLEWFVISSGTNKKWNEKRKKGLEENHLWIQPDVIKELSDEELEKKYLAYYKKGTGEKQHLVQINRKKIISDKNRFRETVLYLLDESIDISERITNVLEGRYSIPGMGRALATAILMDFKPDKYSLWNNKTDMGFSALGWELTKHKAPSGEKYKDVLKALHKLKDLGQDLHLTLLDVDLFLHTISAEEEGKKIIKEIIDNGDNATIFMNIIKRYKDEGTVFQSPSQGARYFISDVDESGCTVQRIDAKEPIRVTDKLLQSKLIKVHNNDGKYRFNDLDGTAATRTTVLQGLPFGLSHDKNTILNLSDDDKACKVFCEIVKNLRVDTVDGQPRLYKPAMLACIIEALESGELNENKIAFDWITPRFINKMTSLGVETTADNAAMPFFYLTGDLFWMLCYYDTNSIIDSGSVRPTTIRSRVRHAIIKDTFWLILQKQTHRKKVLAALAEKWWPDGHQFWWVNQGKSFQRAKEEGCIWAPKENRRGKTEFHWENVHKVKNGDIIFNYANRKIRAVSIAQSEGYENIRTKSSSSDYWGDEGWRADLSYYEIEPPIPVEDIGSSIAKLNLKYGPIDRTGGANQGYLFKLNKEAAIIISDKLSLKSLPTDIKNRIADLIDIDQPNGGAMTATEIVNHIYNWMEKQGFVISKADLINFYCCLRTKPFVLLAGISGTGKTKLARLFAEAVGATEENHRFQLIPVRPDWNDNSELLGFFDLNNLYQPGALVPLLIRAHANPNKPYFLCLDEMNLARVEHYFSDFLSIIESRRFHRGKVTTDQMLSQEQMQKMNEENLDEEIKYVLTELKSHQIKGIGLPENLYVIGTVNMDETTHPFSRKVLDRANTIEFSDVHLTKGLTITQDQEKPNELDLGNDAFRAQYLTMIDLLKVDKDIPKEISERLNNLNNTLSKAGCQVGYRVRDEAAFYMKNVIEIAHDTLDKEAGFERVILQKILPRLQGSSYQIKAVLEDLLRQHDSEGKDFNFDDEEYTAKMQTLIENKGPLVKKIGNMLIQFMEDGFTSFWAN